MEYSEELVEEIAGDVIEPTAAPEPEAEEPLTPNVVFVQLESFFDVDALEDASFSTDPIPVFRELMETCPARAAPRAVRGRRHGQHRV